MLKFWQKIKSDLPVMSRGSGLPQKFKVMSEGRAGLKKVQSRGVPGGGMVPEQFEWHIRLPLKRSYGRNDQGYLLLKEGTHEKYEFSLDRSQQSTKKVRNLKKNRTFGSFLMQKLHQSVIQ